MTDIELTDAEKGKLRMRKVTWAAIVVVAFFVGMYLFHPSLNPCTIGFYVALTAAIAAVSALVLIFCGGFRYESYLRRTGGLWGDAVEEHELVFGLVDLFENPRVLPVMIGCVFVPFAVAVVLWFVGSPIFMSGRYAEVLPVEQSDFGEWDDKLLVEGISLMDTESATRVGSRELGSLQDVVSQFDDDEYYQIIVDGVPQKVSALRYVGFFSWVNNRGVGIPGYVSVDPIRQDADYYELGSINGTGDGMRYVPSAFFNEDLDRHLWLRYPFAAFGGTHFELDDDGRPFFVTQVLEYSFPFGAHTVGGVVITDPTDGSTERYSVDEVPAWVDVVFDGDMLDEMYDWHGVYSGGFLNSIMSKIGCTHTGGDYGYVMVDGEQWIYTGVTSMSGDASNIGFLLASERTGAAFFLPMASADESSAMTSAEGKVQQYGYVASFPSLVSIDGQPTYVMVLKDSAGLIRLYAMVNAESYNVVACEPDLVSCRASYESAMRAAGIEFSADSQTMPEVDGVVGGASSGGAATASEVEFSISVNALQLADDGGDTFLYVLGDDGAVYRVRFADDPAWCMSVGVGDTVSGRAVELTGFFEVIEFA